MGQFIVNAFLKYIQSHPEVLEKLIHQLVQYLLDQLTDTNAAIAKARAQ